MSGQRRRAPGARDGGNDGKLPSTDVLPSPIRLLMLLVALPGARAGAAPLRLEDALRRVAERGPDQAVVAAQVGVAETDVTTARMFPNPQLAVGAGRAEPVFTAGLTLRLPIFGQRGAQIDAAQGGVAHARAEAAASLWRLRHDARVSYYAVARADEEVAIARAAEALARRIADMARERFAAGGGTRLDQEQGALGQVRAAQDISDRAATARALRHELARQLGLDPRELGELADPLARMGDAPPLDHLLDEARARQPELKALAAERAAALLRAGAARAERRPTLSLDLGLEVLDSATCGTGETGPRCIGPRGGLAFDLPLFNLNGGPVARAEAEARLAQLRLDAAARRVETAVQIAAENLAAARARVRFFDEVYVPAADSVEAMAREGFAAGKTGLLPLVEAQRAVLEARLGRAAAQFAAQVSRADLEEASGVALSTP